jgi:hypothetical protein
VGISRIVTDCALALIERLAKESEQQSYFHFELAARRKA